MSGEEFLKFIENKVVGHITDSDLDGVSCRLIAEWFIQPKCKQYIPLNTADRNMDEVPSNFYDNLDVVIFSDIAPPSLEYYQNIKSKNIEVFIFDHHETSKQNLGDLPNYTYSIENCGTKILYDFLTEGRRKQKIIQDYVTLVNTYDTWQLENKLYKHAKDLHNTLMGMIQWFGGGSETQKREKFLKKQYEKFKNRQTGNFYFDLQEQIIQKKALEKEEKNYKEAKKNLQKRVDGAGNNYLFTECVSKVSFIATRLLNEYKDYAYIAIRATFVKNAYKFSLRSANGFAVNTITEKFGGGGHKAAAGMELTEEQYLQFKSGKIHLL